MLKMPRQLCHFHPLASYGISLLGVYTKSPSSRQVGLYKTALCPVLMATPARHLLTHLENHISTPSNTFCISITLLSSTTTLSIIMQFSKLLAAVTFLIGLTPVTAVKAGEDMVR